MGENLRVASVLAPLPTIPGFPEISQNLCPRKISAVTSLELTTLLLPPFRQIYV